MEFNCHQCTSTYKCPHGKNLVLGMFKGRTEESCKEFLEVGTMYCQSLYFQSPKGIRRCQIYSKYLIKICCEIELPEVKQYRQNREATLHDYTRTTIEFP